MKTSEVEKELKIGDIFTPLKWGEFAISQFNIFRKWMKGATIFDPTMGHGHLLEALILHGQRKGYAIQELPTQNLYGNELNYSHHKKALSIFRETYKLDMSQNLWNKDLLDLPEQTFDIILGNPPWQNYVDLPDIYKQKIKPLFAKFDLIDNKRNLLLGGSRIDIAALIIQVSIAGFLKEGGDAYFFMPLSLLLNDGAHQPFRTYKIHETSFAPIRVFDFNKEAVFQKVSTRYGLVHFSRNQAPDFPIKYSVFKQNKWEDYLSAPVGTPTAPLSIYKKHQEKKLNSFNKIKLSKDSMPRQGLNTCGANNVFFFNICQKINEDFCMVDGTTKLPTKFVFPLLKSVNFKNQTEKPVAWVLIPHDSKGMPLSEDELNNYPELKSYLENHRQKLTGRKGTLINGWIKKGRWWALLGVGSYNYASYKVVWEAYGRKCFCPIIVSGIWQANQALQAFIPAKNKAEANKILKALKNPAIEEYLLSTRMEGTMNWAQPGKIKKLIEFE
ncbi:Eco57I restriction-modification methylase domain-containing protein [Marinilabilia rubra]|uniref:site-specific DNA-methyltransferase (adenine-specific) n=1 Tax=Marinilabilia rubra TaxID=2162893 RepID=A0A2U2BDK9_9BACT|nr:SAM-dependent methyltransferase [Marinilabilia rubra]PWE01148.1 SAM-dependent methyltransferase [Marinilabilia rubra]